VGECKVFVAWHIDDGKFDGIKLDGLNVAAAIHAPGHMLQVKWEIALYIDEKANAAQGDALTKIFSGQAGGHPAVLGSFVGEVLGVKNVPIEFSAAGRKRSLKVDDVLAMEIEGIDGQGGAEVTVSNPPLCVVPGIPSVVAKSKNVSFKEHFPIELSGTNGYYSAFAYQP